MIYKLGDRIGDRVLVGRTADKKLILKCIYCGALIKDSATNAMKRKCLCMGKQRRFSGLTYVNPPEKIEALKEKYKNGVTEEILQEFFEKLK